MLVELGHDNKSKLFGSWSSYFTYEERITHGKSNIWHTYLPPRDFVLCLGVQGMTAIVQGFFVAANLCVSTL